MGKLDRLWFIVTFWIIVLFRDVSFKTPILAAEHSICAVVFI